MDFFAEFVNMKLNFLNCKQTIPILLYVTLTFDVRLMAPLFIYRVFVLNLSCSPGFRLT